MIVQGLLMKGGRATRRRGFTLIELLVVILIILMVSAVTLPSVISAFNHRQVSEAARILQGGLVGARDTAINTNAPAGIRLLPDPVFNGQSLNVPGVTGVTALDPRVALASNRFVPIQLAPDYSEGFVRVDRNLLPPSTQRWWSNPNQYFIYPASKSPAGVTTYYPAGTTACFTSSRRSSIRLRASGVAQSADLVVLEHPDRRQGADQQLGNLLHRRRPDADCEPRAVRQCR